MVKNDIIWGQANCRGVPSDQKSNKAEELTYPSANIAVTLFDCYLSGKFSFFCAVHVDQMSVGQMVFD
jgi:hypothetical protein